MKHLILLIFLGLANIASGQSSNNDYNSKYDDPGFNGIKVLNVLESSGFKPVKSTTDMRQFKSAILVLSERAYAQINIDTWSLCSNKHEEYFLLYNMYYKPVSKDYYDTNCKGLIALMLLDGTAIKKRN
jgi:hypothetical protein